MTVLLALLACTPEPRDPAPVLALTGDVERGTAQYQMRCATCHGASGGGVARNPALAGRISQLSDAELAGVLLNGKGAMPRQSGLTDQHAADVLAYLRKAFP